MRRSLALIVAVLLLAAGTAAADEAADKPRETMTMPKGKLVVNGFIEINLSENAAFKPVSLTPDVWYGVNDKLTLGLVHSSIAASGFVGGVADSLCITGLTRGCAKIYRNVGLKARYRLKAPWTFDGGLLFPSVAQPTLVDIQAGASGRWRFKKIVVEFQPNLVIAVNQRSSGSDVLQPRSQRLNLPGTVGYTVALKIELNAQLGLSVPTSSAGDFYTVPFSVGGRYMYKPNISFGLMFALPALLAGGKLTSGISTRTLILGVTYAR
ncbi:MAG: hypothetical protein H0T46_23580 [Deltaproteobacteria bacterium]|nr:hypothetical protein [Deltaproteobacteria bacterium]